MYFQRQFLSYGSQKPPNFLGSFAPEPPLTHYVRLRAACGAGAPPQTPARVCLKSQDPDMCQINKMSPTVELKYGGHTYSQHSLRSLLAGGLIPDNLIPPPSIEEQKKIKILKHFWTTYQSNDHL